MRALIQSRTCIKSQAWGYTLIIPALRGKDTWILGGHWPADLDYLPSDFQATGPCLKNKVSNEWLPGLSSGFKSQACMIPPTTLSQSLNKYIKGMHLTFSPFHNLSCLEDGGQIAWDNSCVFSGNSNTLNTGLGS